ncbi:TldD/PmbA family protein [Sandaracinobacter sp. RS1-74]|uniref:TldD/PmbA family protein n=1 Tax=Sandaracinobacteroides sayramensis TaxID=2913411 RepID=UPI001EDB98A1|nr:TldD/PmbA family protein [Sandaracinobacteroides sayramensis]MCG2839993.1 TldD/PmbA family protein [Sandaracinobacteroides sayramensis]
MLTQDQALDRLDHLLGTARKSGADKADAVYFGEASTGIGVRHGALEDIGRSEGEEIGLRLFLGDRSAQVSVSDLSPQALDEAVQRALSMAREATSDPYAGLAPQERLAKGPFADFDLFDPAVEALPAERLKAMALEAEDAARAVPGISTSEGGSASAGLSVSALATSHGFRGAASGTSVSVSAVVIAGDGAGRQRDYEWHSARHLSDLESPADIGREAGERTVKRLNPGQTPTGALPVVFDPRVSASLIGHLLGAISGSSIARKTSFLIGREDESLFAPGIAIHDNPHLPRALRSRAFDGEGLPTAPRSLVSGGRLTGWLIDSASGRQLSLAPTGHASRGSSGPPGVSASNLWLEAGSESPEELISDVKDGLYVNELIGMGVSLLTGDYSRGAGGFRIRDGRLAEPVAEATIAGHLLEMFRALRPANDLQFRQASNAPTIRVDGMTIAG